jgi:hypothetical protein
MLMLLTASIATSVKAEGTAQIWTDKADYTPEETVTIFGSGFVANATITGTVTRPNGMADSWTATSDVAGNFVATYQLDGIVGIYTVTATDGINMATTTFKDAQPARVVFATGGLPVSTSVSVTWNGTNNGGQPISGNTTFSSPGPSAFINTDPASSFSFSFPSSITTGGTTYSLSSTNATSPLTTGASGSTTAVNATYTALPTQFLLTVRTSGLGTHVTNVYNGTTILGNATDATPFTLLVDAGSLVNLDIDSPVTDGTTSFVFTAWSGNASGMTRPYNFSSINSAEDVTATYKTQYYVAFSQSGVGSDFLGAVMTVNGTGYDRSGFSAWTDAGDNYVFSYVSPLVVSASKQYVLTGVNASSPLTVTAETTVTGTYTTVELTYTGATSGQYSDPVTVSALLTNSTGSVQGVNVTFTIGTQSAWAITDSGGVASTTIVLNQPAGNYKVKATCAGASGTTLSDEKDFTIYKENVAITYTGDTWVSTAGPTITTAQVRLSGTLVQEADGYLGNLTLARVTFVLSPTSGSDITISNVPVSALGEALTTLNVPIGDYYVEVTISSGNLYWTQKPYGDGVLHVEAGTNEKRVTGGGWIPDIQSVNGKGNFGFTVNYNKNGAPKGNFVYVFRGTDGYNYVVKSNSWQDGGLSFSGTNKAYFSGKCNVQKIDRATGQVVESWGGYRFAVDITDGDIGSPQNGCTDKIAITIFNSRGGIWRQIGTYAAQILLGGGNIVIHSK